MALYRRFAVYLYQYQGEKKGAGAGFGMIELRDGRIRMQLTGRGSAAQGNLEVYGLLDASSPEEMVGIRLGSMQAGRFLLEAGEAIGEGKSFSDLRGIVLTIRPGAERAVAALWNGSFDAGRFVQWKAPKTDAAKQEQPEEMPVEADQVPERLPGITKQTQEQPEEFSTEKTTDNIYIEETTTQTPPVEVQAERMDQPQCPKAEPHSCSQPDSLLQEPAEQPHDATVQSTVQQRMVSSTEQIPKIEAENSENAPSQLDFASAALDLVEFGLPLEIQQEKPFAAKKSAESLLWQRLSKQYPKMKIPMQGESVLCLRIRPCDINRLPKANWKYGCSHFLARHYNRYRCLIVGRVLHEDGFEYFMGIPGGNTTQERMQAAEAGFDHYIGIERISPQWPEGFWLVQLQWEE